MRLPRLAALFDMRKPAQAILLRADGAANVLSLAEMMDRTVPGPDDTGRYVVEDYARFTLKEPIKAGPIAVYVETDPEPVSLRKPVGYGPKELDILMGGWVTSVLRRAHEPKKQAVEWRKLALVGLVALAAGIAAYMTFF